MFHVGTYGNINISIHVLNACEIQGIEFELAITIERIWDYVIWIVLAGLHFSYESLNANLRLVLLTELFYVQFWCLRSRPYIVGMFFTYRETNVL